MIPLLDAGAMREADARAVRRRGQEALVRDAGTAVALLAARMLGTPRARRVVVVEGPGLNGADGRVAASKLRDRGAKVTEIDFDDAPPRLSGYDLVIDAAFGLGCSRPYVAPDLEPGTLVLAVDLPSGVDADTGELLGRPFRANATLALGAVKPALLDGEAAAYAGDVHFAGLGIVEEFRDALLVDDDLRGLVRADPHDHKWKHAVQVAAGSSSMPGAAELVLRGALVGGASMTRLASPGGAETRPRSLPEVVYDDDVDPRCRATVAGPGLGPEARSWLADQLGRTSSPVVLDADALDRAFIDAHAPDDASWILTPHDAEFARLFGAAPSRARFRDVRALAKDTGCVVLLKGPTTVIAHPDGRLRVVNAGTAALATAGSGDVLAGLIGATLARGHEPLEATALAAHVHARAGSQLPTYATALDLVEGVRRLVRSLK